MRKILAFGLCLLAANAAASEFRFPPLSAPTSEAFAYPVMAIHSGLPAFAAPVISGAVFLGVTLPHPTPTAGPVDVKVVNFPASSSSSGGTVDQGTGGLSAWKVDGSAVTQPVSGTIAATQSGTWTVQPGNTANTTAWKVDGSAVTQPVSGTFWPATQPVSGTVTVTDGAGALNVIVDSGAIAATQSGTWNVGTVSAVTAITNALPAGSNVIGHVVADSGSTTAVTGNVTAVQATGTNLHTVVDSGTVTTVGAVTTISSPVTVTDGAGALNVIVDSGSITDTRLPTALGQTTVSASLPVTLASDQPALALPVNAAQETGGNLAKIGNASVTVGTQAAEPAAILYTYSYPVAATTFLIPPCNKVRQTNCR
jgi:hypothetical protein